VAINIPILTSFNGKGVAQAQREFKSLSTTTQKAGFILQRALLPAAAAIGTITQVIGPAIKAASDFEEATSKVNVIFGQASKSIKDFAATAATSLGQSKQSVLDAAGAFGTFGKSAGLAGEDLALFTTDFVTLSTDLASFNNTTPEEAVQAIGAALRGESEPLRRFGVLLNDATLKSEAMRLGIYKGSGALTAQQKILAAQAAIYKQTGDAQGDFARTADGLANSQRTLTALFKNLQIELGQKLLPVTTNFVNSLIDIKDALDNIPKPAKSATTAIAEFIAKAVLSVNPLVKLYNIITQVGNVLNKTTDTTGAYNQSLNYGTQQAIRMADAAALLANGLEEEENAAGGATKKIESFATALKDKLGEAVDTAKEKLAEAQGEFNDFATKVSDAVMGALDFNKALEDGNYGFKGFLDSLRKQVKGVEDYGNNLQTALAMNLSEDALGFVIDAGSEAGAKIASELVKGGQVAIDETNALVDAAQRAADKVGIQAAERWYKTGVDQAQFIVNGLEAELTKLTPKLMAKMDQIAAKLKRSVNVDVIITERVSRIVSTITSGIPAMASGGIVTGPTLALIGEAGPEAVVPLSQMGNMATGGGVTINVTGGLSTSAEIGQSVVNALRAYSRTAGPLQLQVA
jgi:hypothetical protein